MEEAPAPSASNHALHGIIESLATVGGRLLRLEVVVLLLIAFILATLGVQRTLPRWGGGKVSRGAMGSMLTVAVSYAIGLIQDGPFHGETFVLWASAMLLIQTSAHSTPVHGRRDYDEKKRLLVQHVLQTGLVLWLIANTSYRVASYRAGIWAFWALNVLKTAANIVEIARSRRPDDMAVKVVAEYMAVEEDYGKDQPPNPVTMQGYRYIFHGEETMLPVVGGGRPAGWEEMLPLGKSLVTIDQVYVWIDRQPGSSEGEKDKARDFCLAFALFKLLKRRFYGYVPAEAGSRKARDLVLTGLIHANNGTGPDAAFRVVEAELAFLYDFLYTRTIVLVGAKTYICIAVAVAGLAILWTAFFGTLGPGYHRLHIGVRDLDRSVTVMIVVITAGLEVFQAVAGSASNWRYVKTLYRCVRDDRPWSRPRGWHHLWWKESIAPPETKYWENKVGQYELLKLFRHRPCNLLSWMTLYLLVDPRRQGQKRGRRKLLPPEVRRAVLLTLKQNNCELSNGVATLRRHRLLPRLEWACGFPMVTNQILVWHIVTTCCDWAIGRPERRRARGADPEADVNRLIARRLSNYCAYLVAFVPEMLPDPSYKTEQTFDTAVRQARDHLDGCRSYTAVLARLAQIADFQLQPLQEEGGTYERAGDATVIERAAVLWWQLREGTVTDARQWQVLAEFWAELVLFLAPSDNVDIHIDMLGAGGEFMTQLWALLTNAGVLERPPGQGSRGGIRDNLLDLLPRESEQRRATAN